MIKAIETHYAGCRFRSRLEARWAVFFNHLGVAWEYEPEGYHIGPKHDRRMYLPDFYLPKLDVWVEVKGDRNTADLRMLAYAASSWYGLPKASGPYRILLLGNVPHVKRGWEVWHQALTYHDGQDRGWDAPVGALTQHPVWFHGKTLEPGYQGFITHENGVATPWIAPGLVLGHERDHFTQMNVGPSHWQFDAFVTTEYALWPAEWQAYTAARSARFEHGESGA